MGKKLQRVFRDRRLTTEEQAHDESILRQVQEEFHPATRSARVTGADLLSRALKQAIQQSDKSVYQIAKRAGVSQIVVSRFLSGERDIRLATADKLAEVLELKLESGQRDAT